MTKFASEVVDLWMTGKSALYGSKNGLEAADQEKNQRSNLPNERRHFATAMDWFVAFNGEVRIWWSI
jgi:hypothetical protein